VFDTHAATLVGLIRADTRRWQILRMVESLELPDCWIGAGFVRAAVWDHLRQRQASLSGDVDVVWFDLERADAKADHALEARLRALDPLPWSVTNQARMHVHNTDRPYRSTQDALAFWPDTATAVAVRARGDVIDIAGRTDSTTSSTSSCDRPPHSKATSCRNSTRESSPSAGSSAGRS
jgi:uncharacterized protein